MTIDKINYSRSMLCGQWFSHSINDDGLKCTEYANIAPDGSFEFTFSSFDENEVLIEKVIELGDWGLVGNIHFTMTKNEVIEEALYAADLNNEDNYHAYKVLQLNHKIFEYQHIVTNETYIMRRVIDNIGHC
jgi:hypothetical protein